MRSNRLREIWSDGGTALNGWLSVPSSVTAELMAHQGWDSLCVDLQHGMIDYQLMVPMLQAISTTAVVPLVRVPDNDAAMIGKVLDAGAYGVICPMVNSADEAAAFVGAMRYAPLGCRSVGPVRAPLYAGSDYVARANETIIAMAMIETEAALSDLDGILRTPGLDAVYVGPSDLSLSLGHAPGFDPRFPAVLSALERVATEARRHGVVPCVHVGSLAYGLQMRDLGFRLITYFNDVRFLQWVVSRSVAAFRAGAPTPDVP